MKNNFYIKILSAVILTLFSLNVSAEENVSEHQYNFYTGILISVMINKKLYFLDFNTKMKI